jgi:type I restriction enzyme S subunit
MNAILDQVSVTGLRPLTWGWRSVTLEDLVANEGVFVDGDWVESKDQDPSGDVRLIQLADVGDGEYRNRSERFLTTAKASELGCTFLEPGDLLVARMPDPLGRACIFPGDRRRCVTVVDVAIVRSRNPEVNARWLMHCLNAPQFRQVVTSLQGGSTRQRISRRNLAKIVFPLPPLQWQVRVVEEIEKQFSRLDEAVANLKRVTAGLTRYRAATLAGAFAVKPGWAASSYGEVGMVTTGFTPPTSDKANFGGAIPFYKPTDLDAGENIVAAREYLSDRGLSKGRLLPANSVLVTCIGATIGKTGLARVACATNQQINAVSPDPAKVDPSFLYWWTVSPQGQEQIVSNASATTLPILNKSKFSALAVPLPPIAEQRRIVAEVERRLSIVREVEAEVHANLRRAQTLRQAVLARHFQGLR